MPAIKPEPSSNITIRPAHLDDLPEILEVRYDAVAATAPMHYTERETKVYLQDAGIEGLRTMIENGTAFVICDEKTILGCGAWHEAHLRHVYIRPTNHGQGLGQKLVQYIEQDYFQKTSAPALKAGSAVGAYGFYKKLGYTMQKEDTAWDGSRYYEMEKELNN